MSGAKIKKSKYIFLFLRIAVVLGGIAWAIAWLHHEQRWNRLAEIIHRTNMWVFAGTLCIFIIGMVITGLRWWLLLRAQSIFIGFWAAVRLFFLGWFYNNFMPGSVGGDLIRAWYVTKHTDKKFEAVLSVFVDRAIGLLTTLVIAVFFYSIFLRGRGRVINANEQGGFPRSVAEYGPIFFWLVLVVAAVFCVLLSCRSGRVRLRKAWSYICEYAVKVVKKLTDAFILYCRKPLTILVAFGLTVVLQVMVITGFWFLDVSMGIEASLKYYYVFFTLTWVLGALPVSIGGVVVVEVVLASMFIKFAGVGEGAASALALSQRAVWMLASLPGAVIHLFGAHLPKDFFIDDK